MSIYVPHLCIKPVFCLVDDPNCLLVIAEESRANPKFKVDVLKQPLLLHKLAAC